MRSINTTSHSAHYSMIKIEDSSNLTAKVRVPTNIHYAALTPGKALNECHIHHTTEIIGVTSKSWS